MARFEPLQNCNAKLDWVNLSNLLYRDVFEKRPGQNATLPANIDLPFVNAAYRISALASSRSESLLKLQNGDCWLMSVHAGKGTVYLFASPLDPVFSNFPQHALFVPTLYNMAIFSVVSGPLSYTIGEESRIELKRTLNGDDQVVKMRQVNGTLEFIPMHLSVGGRTYISPRDQVTVASNYELLEGKEILQGVSFNDDRKESELAQYSNAEINKLEDDHQLDHYILLSSGQKPLDQVITELNKGIRLWKWFIILALLFITAEIAIIRLWKQG